MELYLLCVHTLLKRHLPQIPRLLVSRIEQTKKVHVGHTCYIMFFD